MAKQAKTLLNDSFKEAEKQLKLVTDETKNLLSNMTDKSKALASAQEEYADRQRLINEMLMHRNELDKDNRVLLDKLLKAQTGQYEELKKQKKEVERITEVEKNRKKVLDKIWQITKDTYKFLMDQDRIIRTTIISLGMSGKKADDIRTSFERSSATIYALGGNLEDVLKIMTGFADETGRARALSVETVKAIEQIGRGTGLGIEAAAQLGGQFEMIGIDAVTANKKIQSIVDTSEKMGLNTVKILKSVNENFKKAQTFTFKGGIKAMADMAINAEKTRLSMSKTFDIAEASRNLEKVIELGANLQIMGGEFSKMDPLQWIYTARNEPEKLNEQISQMSRGLYTLKKDSEGIFSAAITPADADRMRFIAKQLNLSTEEFAEIAKKRLLLDKMDFTLKGLGFSKEQKEWVAGVAELNTKTGQYQVKVNDTLVNIKDLTQKQANSFIQEQTLLQKRAQDNITFNEQWLLMINQLKVTFLPLIRGLNWILKPLTKFSEWYGKLFEEGKGTWARSIVIGIGSITVAFIGLKFAMAALTKLRLGSILGGMGGLGKNAMPLNAAQTLAGGKASMYAGKGRLLGGLGTAAAAIGIGTGIMLAAKGISQLADAMSKLSDEKARLLTQIATTMAFSFPAAAFGISAFSKSLSNPLAVKALASLSVVMLSIGASMAMAGAGIGIATTGISKLADSMSKLSDEKAKTLQYITMTLAVSFPLAAVGLKIIAAAAKTSSVGLGILSGTLLAVGASIGIAAAGLSTLALAMSKLTDDKAKSLQYIAMVMATTFPLAAIGVKVLGTSAKLSAPGLKALSISLLAIGGSIAIAAAGLASLALAMSTLTDEKAKSLQYIAMTMAISFPLAAVGLRAVSVAAKGSAAGLKVLSLTFLAIGGSIAIAAAGLASLALAMSTLTDEKAKSLQYIAMTMAVSFPLAAIGLKTVSAAAKGSAAGIGILSAMFLAIGGSIAIAAAGLSGLALAMSTLTNEKAKSLQYIAMTMAVSFPLAAIGVVALGNSAEAASYGLLILSAAFIAIGGGIWLASTGIAKMMEGLSKLTTSAKGSGWELAQIGLGIAAINTALAATGPMGFLGGALGGFSALKKTINTITAKSTELKMIGDSFKNIAAVLSGNENDYKDVINLVNSISKLNTAKSGMFSELAEIMKKPLKVEFENNQVQLYNDISLSIDSEKVFKSTYTVQRALGKHVRAYHQGMDK